MISEGLRKFDEQGNAIPYYGNTVVSFLNDEKTFIFKQSVKVQNIIQESEFAQFLAFLPPSSFHMTVLTLCRERDRNTSYWPSHISRDADFCEVDVKLKDIVDKISMKGPILMEVDCCEINQIVLKPHREEDAKNIIEYRNQVAAATGIKHPWHDGFRYHISLNYKIKNMDHQTEKRANELCNKLTQYLKETVAPFEIPKEEFVIFNDMMTYEVDLNKRGV